jgi:hypothetical protein
MLIVAGGKGGDRGLDVLGLRALQVLWLKSIAGQRPVLAA